MLERNEGARPDESAPQRINLGWNGNCAKTTTPAKIIQELARRVAALEAGAVTDAEERGLVANVLSVALAHSRQLSARVAALEAALSGREVRDA